MDYMLNIATKKDQKVEIGDNFYISMSPGVYQELTAYVAHYTTEVSGNGMVEVIKHENTVEYFIKEVFLPAEQDNSGSSTEIDEKMMHTMVYNFAKQGIDGSKFRMHWHSHAKMGVFHSGTDVDNYATMLKQDFYVSLVMNHDKELFGRVDLAIPFTISISGVPVYVKIPLDSGDAIQSKIDSNLKALDEYIEEKKEEKKFIGFDWRNHDKKNKKRDRQYKSNERNKFNQDNNKGKYNKGELYDMYLEQEKLSLLETIKIYSSYEQSQYTACMGTKGGRHTCNNMVECEIYNDLQLQLQEVISNESATK